MSNSKSPNNLKFVSARTLGVPVKPSDKIYFDDYFYRVRTKGAYVYHDIELHENISMWFTQYGEDQFREHWSNKGRSFYLPDYHMLEAFVNTWSDIIDEVTGPINQNHLDILLDADDDYSFRTEFRDKKYYGKYAHKLEFTVLFQPNIKQRSGGFDSLGTFIEIDKIVSAQTNDYKWYTKPTRYSGRMYYNFLYLKEEDYNIVLTMLLLTHKSLISTKVKVVTHNEIIDK